MRIVLRGAPENQMPVPEGIVSRRIDRATGCPARAGQPNSVFEYFREDHVPECEDVQELLNIFNDASGIDPVEEPGTEELPAEEEAEPLF
jgi:penicillin-binding protein 1A